MTAIALPTTAPASNLRSSFRIGICQYAGYQLPESLDGFRLLAAEPSVAVSCEDVVGFDVDVVGRRALCTPSIHGGILDVCGCEKLSTSVESELVR